MTRKQRRFSAGIAILGLVLFFQNCGSSQNFDLEQATQSLSGVGDLSAPPAGNDGAPAPMPTPTPTPVPTGQATQGQFCARQAGELPKFRLSLADLREQKLEDVTSLDRFFRADVRLANLNIYLPKLDIKALPVHFGYDLGGQGTIRRDDGTELRERFAVMYESYLQLAQEDHGTYQIAVAASGQVELEIQDASGVYVKRISAMTGIDETRFLCVNQNIFIRRGDQIGLRLRQTHRTGASLSAALYWRKVGSATSAASASCNASGELFRDGQATSQMQTILNEGWRSPGADNLTLTTDGENLVVNGDFENVSGLSLPTTGTWWKYFTSLPGWLAYQKFELQNSGFTNVFSFRGGNYWIELDADQGVDAIHQEITVKPNTSYRHLFDYATEPGTSQNTSQILVYRVASKTDGNFQFDHLDTVSAPNTGAWLTYQRRIDSGTSNRMKVKLMEGGGDDNNGAYIDNVVFREIRENDRVCLGGAIPAPGIKILAARYGKNKFVDTTTFVRARCEDKASCSFNASNDMNGDPENGIVKVLTIRYSCLNGDKEVAVNENTQAQLSCP